MRRQQCTAAQRQQAGAGSEVRPLAGCLGGSISQTMLTTHLLWTPMRRSRSMSPWGSYRGSRCPTRPQKILSETCKAARTASRSAHDQVALWASPQA